MKSSITLVICSVLICGAAIAHEEPIKKAIGFIHLQNFHADRPTHRSKPGDYDPTPIPRGVLLYQDTWGSAKLKTFDYVQLKSANVRKKRNPMAYVFDQKSGWYQLGTDEGQYLWVNKIDTSGYINLKDILNNSCFYLDITSTIRDYQIKVSNNLNGDLVEVRTWRDVVNQHIFSIKEIQEIEEEIWINLTAHWYEPWHSKTQWNKEDEVFESSRWTTAHGSDGLFALSIIDHDCK